MNKVITMGGAKKKSLSQMEKAQRLAEEKAEKAKKQKVKTVIEKRVRSIEMPQIEESKLIAELSKLGAITPYAVASQFNIKVGVAKRLLEELEKKNIISLVGGNARLRIYKMAVAAA
jgi:small subunit ribosomal protein S25e